MSSYFKDIKPLQDAIKALPRDQRIMFLRWLLEEVVKDY
jgi:hypothetical protein